MIRHGRTSWNDVHRFQGRSDIPLNDAGFVQAQKTALRLAKWPLGAIYTSPLTRARQTALTIAAPHQKEPIVLDELIETDFGAWEGLNFEEIEKNYPDKIRAWLRDPFFHAPERAETWDSIRVRVLRVLEIIFRADDTHIAVVAHGGIIRALFALLLDFDPHSVWNIQALNCALNGVEIRSEQASLVFSNDDLHLKCGDAVLPVW